MLPAAAYELVSRSCARPPIAQDRMTELPDGGITRAGRDNVNLMECAVPER